MNTFIEIPASKKSLGQRKLIYSVGINDANYLTNPVVDGKKIMCPYYQKWQNMIERCYSVKLQERHPTYRGCTVCKEWLLFSNFKAWMITQRWWGMQLDKDIKINGNKIYSPKTCLFIPRDLNTLLVTCSARRGDYPLGVSLSCGAKRTKAFTAHISYQGKLKFLGYFLTSKEASTAYLKERAKKIQKLIDDNTYPMATEYLNQYI